MYEESDEYCPHCDNKYVLEAKTPNAALVTEGDDARIDSRAFRDERVQQRQRDVSPKIMLLCIKAEPG